MPQLPGRLINAQLPVVALVGDMGLDEFLEPVHHSRSPFLVLGEMDGKVVDCEPDKRFVDRGILTPNENVRRGLCNELDNNVKCRQAASGVKGCDVGCQKLFFLSGFESPLGVKDEPERHAEYLTFAI